LLVAVEVAIALVLLSGASLLTNSFLRMVHADWGFNPAHVLVLEAPLSSNRPADISAARIQYVNNVLERISRIPGVISYAAGYGVPILYGYWSTQFAVSGHVTSWGADTWFVSPGYFRTLGVPVLRGRTFKRADNEHGLPSVIVNKSFADKLWPGRDPIGRYIQPLKLKKALAAQRARDPRRALPPEILAQADSWEPDGAPRKVVGEVGDIRAFSLNLVPRPNLYIDYTQATRLCCGEKFVVRVSGNPGKMIPPVRSAILAVDPHVANLKASVLGELVNASIGGRGSNKLLLVISLFFGGLSFLLTLTGIYGVVSFAVAQRTREIGVRVALGARRAHIVSMVIGQVLGPVIFGLLLGLAGVVATSSLLERFLFGVKATDPLMLLVVGLSIVIAAGMACLPPVFRALRISPSDALRYE
jgi:putative ABC transport system permease protein